jgi:hypothetical protein
MSWQEDLQKLDDELSSGNISIEEHRKRREELLASASSAASAPAAATPLAEQNSAEQNSTELSDQVTPPEEPQATTGESSTEQPDAAEATQQVPAATAGQETPDQGPPQPPPESPAEQTAWVVQHPGTTQAGAPASPQPQWQQQPQPQRVPTFPPNPQYQQQYQQAPYQYPQPQRQQQFHGEQVPQPGYQQGPPPQAYQQGPPRSPLPPSAQWANMPQRPPGQGHGNAGEAWQPNWNREWEPGPGGKPFDAFDPTPASEAPQFDAKPKQKRGSAQKIIAMTLAGLVLLALIGTGVWYFFLRDDGRQAAAGAEKPKVVPIDIDGMLAALPRLPGAANNEMGPTIPTKTGAEQGLYPMDTADQLIAKGTNNIVYKASVDGTMQYGVLAVPSAEPKQVSDAIVGEQTTNGWRQAAQPGTPRGGTGLVMTKGGITYHRVLYNAGRWTIFIGVSPDKAGNDSSIRKSFGGVVRSVTRELPPS